MAWIRKYSKELVSNLWIQVFLVLNWIIRMEEIDSIVFPVGYEGAMLEMVSGYSSVYLLCGLWGLFCLWYLRNHKTEENIPKQHMTVLCVCAFVFSLSVLLANYDLFFPIEGKRDLITIPIFLAGGVAVAMPILLWMYRQMPAENGLHIKEDPYLHSHRRFWFYFLGIAAAYLLYLKFVAYPGYFSGDTITIFKHITRGSYSKRYPIWYSLFIKLCLAIGSLLGGEGNSALVVYSVIQSIAAAAVFAYGILTMHQAGVPKRWQYLVLLMMLFLPYHVHYSVTIWKDIPFGLAGCSMAIALYRIFDQIGSKAGNHGVFAVSSFIFCLSRTNGWYSFGIILLILVLIFRSKPRSFFGIAFLVFGISWLMINPLADLIVRDHTDLIEVMTIPFQQVGRLIWKGYELPEEDLALLSNVLNIEKVKQLYSPYIVDPMKFKCFDRSQYDYFMDHIGQYASLWVRWGIQHPVEYLNAWVEETKGYWNGGYNYYIYIEHGDLDSLGFIRETMSNPVSRGYRIIFDWLEGPDIFKFLYSIGFHVWLLLGTTVICVLKKRNAYLLSIPALVVLGGLWLCAPVFSEFRYAYIVFLTVPFLLSIAFFSNRTKEA